MKKIGVIGATYEAAADFIKLLGRKSEGRFEGSEHPEILLHLPKRSEFLRSEQSREESWSKILLSSVEILADAGAELVVCPSNGAHIAYAKVAESSRLPWIPLPEVVAKASLNAGYQQVGLLGTSYLLESSIYHEAFAKHGIQVDIPDEEARGELHRIIRDELFFGRVGADAICLLNSLISTFKENGAQAVALICTELQLALDNTDSPLPLLDSLDLLAEATLTEAHREE